MKRVNFVKTLLCCLKFYSDLSPKLATLYIINNLLAATKIYFFAIISKSIINTLVDQIARKQFDDIINIFQILLLQFGLEFAYSIYMHVSKYYVNKFTLEYQDNLKFILNKKFSEMDISNFDSAERRDNLTQVSKDIESIEKTYKCFVSILIACVTTIVSSIIIIKLDVLLTLMILISMVPSFFAKKRIQKNQYIVDLESNNNNRKINYIFGLFKNRQVASELRLYNYTEFLFNKLKTLLQTKNKNILTLNKKNSVLEIICFFLAGIINAAYNFYIIIKILLKNLTIGDYSYYSTIVGNFKGNVESILNNIASCIINIEKADNYFAFFKKETNIKSGQFSVEPMKKIEFVNVSFSYPNSGILVLSNVSFEIKKGEKVAFAGLNGAGKTTIIKLLFRFYDPSSGQILYNGKDIRDYNLNEYRKQFSALLQDSINFSLSLKENIIISQFEKKYKSENLLKILQKVGFEYSISDLERQVNKDFDSDGIVLSRGQSQSLRIARTLYRNVNLCVFDEPDSNLDAVVEKLLFDIIFSNLEIDKTFILISHRLSNLRRVDKIIYLSKGQVIGCGNHKNLYTKCKEYYELYKTQSDQY